MSFAFFLPGEVGAPVPAEVLFRAAESDQEQQLVAVVHELAADIRRHARELAAPELARLAFDRECERALQHQVDLLLLFVTMNPAALAGAQAEEVQPEGADTQLLAQALEAVLAVGIELRECDSGFHARTVWDVTLEDAIRAGWCRWTSDPVDQPAWTETNPASGQCASTALVVQDRLGGELLIADVHEADGSRQGVHYWNRLPGGREVDLTREQFRRGEVVGEPEVIERPADVTRGRLAGQYHLLAARVARLGEPAGAAVSVKGVCRDTDGRVLVCRNHRGEWELPGGRPGAGEPFHDCVKRELREETALDVEVERVLGVRLLEVVPGAWVDLVAYECTLTGPIAMQASAEHTALAFAAPDKLDGLPVAYAELIDACSSRPRS